MQVWKYSNNTIPDAEEFIFSILNEWRRRVVVEFEPRVAQ